MDKFIITREPTTVGEMLTEEFLKPLNITQKTLADVMGVSRRTIGDICSGKRRISVDEGATLAALFETDCDFWINLQAAHDAWLVRQLPTPNIRPIVQQLQQAHA